MWRRGGLWTHTHCIDTHRLSYSLQTHTHTHCADTQTLLLTANTHTDSLTHSLSRTDTHPYMIRQEQVTDHLVTFSHTHAIAVGPDRGLWLATGLLRVISALLVCVCVSSRTDVVCVCAVLCLWMSACLWIHWPPANKELWACSEQHLLEHQMFFESVMGLQQCRQSSAAHWQNERKVSGVLVLCNGQKTIPALL